MTGVQTCALPILAAFANAIRALIMFDGHADEREMEILRDLVEMMEDRKSVV